MTDPAPLPPWAPRQAALLLEITSQILDEVRQGIPADRALQARIAGQRQFGSHDRRLLGDVVFARLRWHGIVEGLPAADAVVAAWMLDGQPLPPAIAHLQQDAGRAAPPVISRSAPVAERISLVAAHLGVDLPPADALLPGWWREESAHLGPWEDRLHEHIHRPPTWLRVDRDRQPELHETLLREGARWAGAASPCSYAFEDSGKVRAWLDRYADSLEIQDIASQQVVRVAAPAAGESWWDACCGAGGKSLQLLDLSGRRLDLTCTDRRESVLRELLLRARRHGLGKVRRYALDLLHNPQLPNLRFDGILLDAPCAGTGTWARNPDAPLRCRAADVRQAARRQLQMLRTVLPVLRPGGRLVYATCSLTRSETLGVVESLLAAEASLRLQPFPHPLTGADTDGTLTLLPRQTDGDGIFTAIFLRIA